MKLIVRRFTDLELYVLTHIHTYLHTHTYTYLHAHIHIHTYTYTPAHAYTHTHTYMSVYDRTIIYTNYVCIYINSLLPKGNSIVSLF